MLSITLNILYSVSQFGHSVVPDYLQSHRMQHASVLSTWPIPGAYSNSCPSSRRCYPTISSSLVPFSSHLQSFPASGSFPVSQLFTSGGQSIGVSASASVLPMNIQDWFPLGWTGWISLLSKGLSRVFSKTTVLQSQPSYNLNMLLDLWNISLKTFSSKILLLCLYYKLLLNEKH